MYVNKVFHFVNTLSIAQYRYTYSNYNSNFYETIETIYSAVSKCSQ